jgi:hypothetical protein
MSTTRYAYNTATTVQIVAIWCNGCGIAYGLPQGFIEARREDHKSWTCPNGCVRHFPAGPSKAEREAQRLREQLDAARSLAERESERRRTAEAERAAARGQVTRLRKRIGNGVCPCCTRTFADLGQHIAGEHPEFRLDEEEPNPTLTVEDLSPNQVWTLQTIGAYLNQGKEGADTMWLHRATVGALVRRGVVTIEGNLAVPTSTGLRLIAAAGSGS